MLKESKSWGSSRVCSRPSIILVYINDIAESLLSLTRLFADDSLLFCSAATIKDIEGITNHDLHMLVSWAAQWLINFNPLKTEVMGFFFTLRPIGTLSNKVLMVQP